MKYYGTLTSDTPHIANFCTLRVELHLQRVAQLPQTVHALVHLNSARSRLVSLVGFCLPQLVFCLYPLQLLVELLHGLLRSLYRGVLLMRERCLALLYFTLQLFVFALAGCQQESEGSQADSCFLLHIRMYS